MMIENICFFSLVSTKKKSWFIFFLFLSFFFVDYVNQNRLKSINSHLHDTFVVVVFLYISRRKKSCCWHVGRFLSKINPTGFFFSFSSRLFFGRDLFVDLEQREREREREREKTRTKIANQNCQISRIFLFVCLEGGKNYYYFNENLQKKKPTRNSIFIKATQTNLDWEIFK